MSKAMTLAKVEQQTALLPMEEIRRQIAKCVHVDVAKDIRDKAKAIEIYQRQCGASLEVQNHAVECRVRWERRLGELLRELPKAKGSARPGVGRRGQCGAQEEPHSDAPTLADLSITKKQSAKWQKVAAVPEPEFERRIVAARGSGQELTVGKVLREPQKTKRKQRPTPKAEPASETEPDESDYSDLDAQGKCSALLAEVSHAIFRARNFWPDPLPISSLIKELRHAADLIEREEKR